MKTFRQKYKKRITIKRVLIGGVKDKCPICLERINKKFYKTNCNHKFHIECLKQWCDGKNICLCPLCKGNLNLEELFSFEERLASCDKEKLELKLEFDRFKTMAYEIEQEWETRNRDIEALHMTLITEYNALAEKFDQLANQDVVQGT